MNKFGYIQFSVHSQTCITALPLRYNAVFSLPNGGILFRVELCNGLEIFLRSYDAGRRLCIYDAEFSVQCDGHLTVRFDAYELSETCAKFTVDINTLNRVYSVGDLELSSAGRIVLGGVEVLADRSRRQWLKAMTLKG